MSAPAKFFCIRCGRTDDDLGPEQCGSGILGCPEPEPFDPAHEVLLSCGPCGITRALPVDWVVRGKGTGHTCVSAVCQAKVVYAAVAPAVPPALGEVKAAVKRAPKQ